MHQHHWDTWLHIPLAMIWMSIPWWVDFIDGRGGHILTVLLGLTAASLQIAYLIRKHLHLKR